jgi:hypothetical protein
MENNVELLRAVVKERNMEANAEIEPLFYGPLNMMMRRRDQPPRDLLALNPAHYIDKDPPFLVVKDVYLPFSGDPNMAQSGLFVAQFVPKDSFVINYRGIRRSSKPDDMEYVFSVEVGCKTTYIDAMDKNSGLARYINCSDHTAPPNIKQRRHKSPSNKEVVSFSAIRDIESGEELRYDYGGEAPWRKRKLPFDIEDDARSRKVLRLLESRAKSEPEECDFEVLYSSCCGTLPRTTSHEHELSTPGEADLDGDIMNLVFDPERVVRECELFFCELLGCTTTHGLARPRGVIATSYYLR